jgi:parallel beta-helix repeat protein
MIIDSTVNAGVIYCIQCDNITVKDVALTNSSVGAFFWKTNNSRIENVNASKNDYGIFSCHSSNNSIASNTVNSNNRMGMYIYYSDGNIIHGNTVNSNNGDGIDLWYSSNNILYHNNLINNTLHNAYDTGTNQWDSGSEGNYYSNYNGTDPDPDGIGNDPHPIPGGTSIDRCPLMQPWTDTQPQKGDLNSDGNITPADAAIALAIAAGGSASCDLATLAAADVSGDNRVTSLDALMILQAAAGRIAL